MKADRDHAMPATHEPRRAARPTLVAALMAATLAACSPQMRIIGGGSGPVLGAPIKIAVGKVAAGFSVVGDATQILRESAADSLEA